jgi:hypothetical protein
MEEYMKETGLKESNMELANSRQTNKILNIRVIRKPSIAKMIVKHIFLQVPIFVNSLISLTIII